MKKRIITSLMALTLMVTIVLPVSAEQEKVETTLELDVKSVYNITIPKGQSIEFANTETELDGELAITGNIRTNEKVVVKVERTEFINKTVPERTIAYTLSQRGEMAEFTTMEWSDVELRAETPVAYDLDVNITEAEWGSAYAGNYESVITFKVGIKNK